MISSRANLVYELPHELLSDLRLTILGNQEILGKSEIWVECSAQSPLHKFTFGRRSKKKNAKKDIELVLSGPFLLDFSFLFQIFCLGFSEQTNFWS